MSTNRQENWRPTDCNVGEASGSRHSIYSFRLLASASRGAGVHAAVSHDILYPLSDKIQARESSFTSDKEETPKGTTSSKMSTDARHSRARSDSG